MSKLDLVIVFLFILSLGLVGLGGYLIGFKLAKDKYTYVDSLLTNYPLGFNQVNPKRDIRPVGFFCAGKNCSLVGMKGEVVRYNKDSKTIGIELDGLLLGGTLTDTTIFDNYHRIDYFEKTVQDGDDLILIFDKTSPFVANEILFIKTGSMSEKKF